MQNVRRELSGQRGRRQQGGSLHASLDEPQRRNRPLVRSRQRHHSRCVRQMRGNKALAGRQYARLIPKPDASRVRRPRPAKAGLVATVSDTSLHRVRHDDVHRRLSNAGGSGKQEKRMLLKLLCSCTSCKNPDRGLHVRWLEDVPGRANWYL